MQPLGRTLNHARLGKAVHQAMTCEPGDLPASGRSCLGPGDGHGTVSFRLSDEPVRLWPHGCVVTGALASACRRVCGRSNSGGVKLAAFRSEGSAVGKGCVS